VTDCIAISFELKCGCIIS